MDEIAELRRWIHSRPHEPRLQLQLAHKLFQQGDFAESAELLRRLRRLPELASEASYLLARVTLAQGRPAVCQHLLRQACRGLGPACDLRREISLLTRACEQAAAADAQERRARLHPALDPLIGLAPSFLRALERVHDRLHDDRPLLLAAPPGSGVRLLAEAICQAGPPAYSQRLLRLDCAARGPAASARLLFGSDGELGLLEQARGGTLLLERVDLLEPWAQVALRPWLERGAAARLILHTHTPLLLPSPLDPGLAMAVRTRQVVFPSLAGRGGDVGLLIDHFWRGPLLGPEVREALRQLPWPGNVAQLAGVLRWLASEPGPITPETVRRFHRRTSPAELKRADELPEQLVDARAWLSPELARAHRVCPLRRDSRLVVALDRPRTHLELDALQGLLGTRARWLQVSPQHLEALLAQAYPQDPALPARPAEGTVAAQEALIALLRHALAETTLPDPAKLTRLVTTQLVRALEAEAVVLYTPTGEQLVAENVSLSPTLVGRRPELRRLHQRACPELDLVPGPSVAQRSVEGLRQVARGTGAGAEAQRWATLGVHLEQVLSVSARHGPHPDSTTAHRELPSPLAFVLEVINPREQGPANLDRHEAHLRRVASLLGQLIAGPSPDPDVALERRAEQQGLRPQHRLLVDRVLCQDVGLEAARRFRVLPLKATAPAQLCVAVDQPLPATLRAAFELETGCWIAETRLADPRELSRALVQMSGSSVAVDLVGVSEAMRELRSRIAERAPERGPVVIEGELGTGKERTARALHSQDEARALGPFRVLACHASTGDPEADLFQAALQADGGTLFLEHVGALSPAAQAQLVELLESGEISRPGCPPQLTDARVVATCVLGLEQELAHGRLRPDLARLLTQDGAPLRTPALRERPEDVPLLVEYFLAREARARREPPRRLADEERHAVIQRLSGYGWPGNVRELGALVTRLVDGCQGGELGEADLDRALSPRLRLDPHVLERIEVLTRARLNLKALLEREAARRSDASVPPHPPALALPAAAAPPAEPTVLRALPAGPVLRALPAGPRPWLVPAPPPQLARPPRFTREGAAAAVSAAAVFSLVMGYAIMHPENLFDLMFLSSVVLLGFLVDLRLGSPRADEHLRRSRQPQDAPSLL